jgi:hypothetical protein
MFVKHEGPECIYDFENILFLHGMEFKPLVGEIHGLKMKSTS